MKNCINPLRCQLKDRADRKDRSLIQDVTYRLTTILAADTPQSQLALAGLGEEIWEGMCATDHVTKERDSWNLQRSSQSARSPSIRHR